MCSPIVIYFYIKQIKDIKIAITKQKYFSHTDDQNSYNPIYRRSLGEEAKDAAKNGAIAGGIAGTVIGKHKGIVDNRHKQAVNQFKKEMEGVFSININKEGISESPMVYKKREYIQESLKDLIEIEDILIPVFNFKN